MVHTQTIADRDVDLCPRCRGLMVQERFEDLPGDFGGRHFQGVRCVNCGEILDPLILEHRTQRPKPTHNRRHFCQQI